MRVILITMLLCLLGCKEASINTSSDILSDIKEDNIIVIDSREVLKSELVLNQLEGVWYYEGQPYNGYSLKFHDNDSLKEKLGFYNGKRHGVARTWSKHGVLRIESYYNQNKLTDDYKSYWENGNLALQVNYVDGKKQGEEKQWYSNGELSKLRQLVGGSEEGIQKAWLPNGQLYVNYEAKNGRIFGLMRANSCYKLEDEKVIRKQNI
ncbi:hypothetical protein H8K90_12205 [Winogradskyella echinorum]|uniref:MORN repeat variant n=1 Tax=Winogradskyella echinorum TaxID=538189 RepID=A0ABR6Y321_9FLAO|nr:hypothetical protein [Winogradskyella echinorum]MBC3847149.1 hypothetical protein [Winogradskyella echinorum]MBC5751497.1 hypothetical protein [Winogradskyella echinorum]